MKNFGNVLWGIVLIVVGLIVGGNALGIIDVSVFFDGWWTLFIIVPCFIGLLIGIVLLLCCQSILNFDIIWKLGFPLILIIIGISFIFKDTFDSKVNEKAEKLNDSKNEDKVDSQKQD